ncbi:sensor histidine kinase [Salinibius halmophilus]|uniref:sensor histidine kinase n=1 Tax=Salinibius halmophilus TaxID=1853216 RepID=UPI000E66B018|nr:histidine kinase [Salinibius halmophilus]
MKGNQMVLAALKPANLLREVILTALACFFIAWVQWLAGSGSYVVTYIISIGYGFSTIFWSRVLSTWEGVRILGVLVPGWVLGVLLGFLQGSVIMLWIAVGNWGSLITWVQQTQGRILMKMALSAVFTLALVYFFYSMYYIKAQMDDLREQQLTMAEKEKQLAISELKALQAQMEPHFLFNTLANLQALIEFDPKQAQHLLTELTGLLRANMKRTRQATQSLSEELSVVRHYLNIQQIRLGDERLKFNIYLPESLSKKQVPPLMIQPLVENAILHGVEPAEEGGQINVEAHNEVDGAWCIEVRNTGLSLGQSNRSSNGLALDNLTQRLASTYGDNALLSLATEDDETVARIRFKGV